MARAPFSMTTSERVKTAAGASPALTKTRWIGRASAAPCADPDHRAVAHEGGVERDRDVVGRHELAEHGVDRGSPAASACAIERDAEARPRGRRDRTAPARRRRRRRRCGGPRSRRSAAPASRARALAAASGGAGERLGVAHQRAQVGVLPLLDAPVRQAGAPRSAGRRPRAAPRPMPARQRGASRPANFAASAGLGRRS